MIHVKSESEIELMREPCRIVKDTLAFVGSRIKAGMTTKEVDELVERYIRSEGAYPSCLGYGGFPASACVSVNEMVVHGIPDEETVLKDGDIVSVDLCAYKNGYHGDACRTFCIGEVSPEVKQLVKVTEESFFKGIEGLKAIVLETYGSGNAPRKEWFIRRLCQASAQGIVIVNVTQCSAGMVEMERYETGYQLLQAGVVSGYDSTMESAVTKLMFLLGHGYTPDEVRDRMNRSIAGEITI